MKKTLVILFSLILFGCSAPQKSLDPSVRHMVKSDKLRVIMSRIDNVIYERQQSELDRDRMRGRYVRSLAQTLRDLSHELELIESLDDANNESRLYKSYGELMYQEARDLEYLAQQQAYENLPQSVENIKNICNSCHAQFGVEQRK